MEDTTSEEIVGAVGRFVEAPDAGDFNALALAAFRFQYRRVPPYRELCRAQGVDPGEIRDWRQIPTVPVTAFRTLELRAAPAVEVFRSSGTTGGSRSVHGHPFPGLYRRVVDRTFPAFCLEHAGERPPMLALVPPRTQLPDSSFGFMVDHVLRRFGGPGSRYAFGAGGVDGDAANAWCRDRVEDGRPGLVLATSFALAQWLEALAGAAARWRLPAGSRIFDTGGFKGRVREVSRQKLVAGLEDRLGIPPRRVVREYGMTELTSQFYTRVLAGGDPEIFAGPPWLKARILDPESLEEAPPGRAGILAIFDLANVGSAVHLLTEDLGVVEEAAEGRAPDRRTPGFRLVGRASDAELRGCSLTVEMLESGER